MDFMNSPSRQKKGMLSEKYHINNESRRENFAYNATQITQVTELQISSLQQCISAYLDSIQMVCRTGFWLSQTFVYFLQNTSSCAAADTMKAEYAGLLKLSVSTSAETRKKIGQALMDFTMPSQNTGTKGIQEYTSNNIKVLERCVDCLFSVHNLFFKNEIGITKPLKKREKSIEERNNGTKKDTERRGYTNANMDCNSDLLSEWINMKDTSENIKSWHALKECSSSLRKYKGLTEMEIQNLLKGNATSSHLYLKKMNTNIDTALKSYEAGLRNLPWKSIIVFGGFYSSPEHAKNTLKGCCSELEIEQNIQRLSISQFLLCELPLFPLKVGDVEHPVAQSGSHTDNILQKKNAVRKLVQATNQKLSISETNDLTSEIVGEICPARWRTQTKACLQLLFGNPGLVIVDTMDQTCKTKSVAQIVQKEHFIVVTVSSLWSIKEDPGTMSLLQRNVDPEKTLATINVRYVCVYNTISMTREGQSKSKFEPGIFVEAFIYTGSKNQRWASQSLDSAYLIGGVPATLLSLCWLDSKPCLRESIVKRSRFFDEQKPETELFDEKHVEEKSQLTEKSQNKRLNCDKYDKKKIFVEIRSESESDEEKSSDNDNSVQDVIHLLSGSTKRVPSKVVKTEKKSVKLENQVLGTQRNENTHHILKGDHVSEVTKPYQKSHSLSAKDLPQQLSWGPGSLPNTNHNHEPNLQLLSENPRKIGQQVSANHIKCLSNSHSHSTLQLKEIDALLEQADRPQPVQDMNTHYPNFNKRLGIQNTAQDVMIHDLNIARNNGMNHIQQNNSNNNRDSDDSRGCLPSLSKNRQYEKLYHPSDAASLLRSCNSKPECLSLGHLPNKSSVEMCNTSRNFKNNIHSVNFPQHPHFDKGPIRRPVSTKQMVEDSERHQYFPMQQSIENQGSNTWPFYTEIMPILQRDIEYERYVAEITKNTAAKKKQSMQIGYPGSAAQDYGEEIWNSFAVSAKPTLMDDLKRPGNLVEVGQIMDGNVDQSRTWPPWQLWHSSGSWNNELLSTINKLETAKDETM